MGIKEKGGWGTSISRMKNDRKGSKIVERLTNKDFMY